MKTGQTFLRDDQSHWEAISVEREENRGFYWFKVVAKWCGYGIMPLWHKENRTFLIGRTAKT